MPIVGMRSSRVICAASSRGMDSSTIENAPAASTARASRRSCSAASSGFALHAESAERVHRLRRQADMAHHRNFGFHQPRDAIHAPLAAFDFHGFGAGFFHEAQALRTASASSIVIAAVGHVRDQQRSPHAAAHGARVVQHFVHGDGQRVFVAEHDHAQRIADEHDVHAGFIEQARRRIVVCRESKQSS